MRRELGRETPSLPASETSLQYFDPQDRGHCVLEVLFDDADRAVDCTFLEVSPSFERQTGMSAASGKRMRELRPTLEEHWFEVYGKVSLSGEPVHLAVESATLARWFDVYAFRLEPRRKGHVAVVFHDITEQRRDEEHYALMTREIQHRARNMVTLLTGVAKLTKGETVHDYKKRLLDRFAGLSRAEAALSSHSPGWADFAAIVHGELITFETGEQRIDLAGPTVLVGERAARCYAMVLHELATNAVKYGALSSTAGRLSVSWQLEDNKLCVTWDERCDFSVLKPTRSGVGSTVIDRCIRHQLQGNIRMMWRDVGLRCEFEAALDGPGL